MTVLVVAVLALAALGLWLGLALAGAVRELTALRARVDALELRAGAPDHLASGPPPGAPAPPWDAVDPDGRPVSSTGFAGRRHLMVFADIHCAACDNLVPGVVLAAAARELPPVAVIAPTLAGAPPAWGVPVGAADRVVVATEHDRAVSDDYHVDLTPSVVVVDEGGVVVASGSPATVDETRELVRSVDGLRIVPGTGDA